MFKLSRPLTWNYQTKCDFICRIDGNAITANILLSDYSDVVHDVLEIEKYLDTLSKTPTTVEEIAIIISDHLQVDCEVSGSTDSHGTITALVRQ